MEFYLSVWCARTIRSANKKFLAHSSTQTVSDQVALRVNELMAGGWGQERAASQGPLDLSIWGQEKTAAVFIIFLITQLGRVEWLL